MNQEISLTPTQKVSLIENVLIQELAGESVLLHLDSEQYFGLDEMGTHMLSILKESESIQVACDHLLQEYEAQPEQIQQDLLDLVAQLAQHDLVQITGS